MLFYGGYKVLQLAVCVQTPAGDVVQRPESQRADGVDPSSCLKP